jgi:DNA-binding response OmpR family regulator
MKKRTLILTITKNLGLLRTLRNRYQVLTLDYEDDDINEGKMDHLLRSIMPDLIIVDVNSPAGEKYKLSLSIRKSHDIPLLMLSSKDDKVRRIDSVKSTGPGAAFDSKGLLDQIEAIFLRAGNSKTANC